jgi:hypothetical protein
MRPKRFCFVRPSACRCAIGSEGMIGRTWPFWPSTQPSSTGCVDAIQLLGASLHWPFSKRTWPAKPGRRAAMDLVFGIAAPFGQIGRTLDRRTYATDLPADVQTDRMTQYRIERLLLLNDRHVSPKEGVIERLRAGHGVSRAQLLPGAWEDNQDERAAARGGDGGPSRPTQARKCSLAIGLSTTISILLAVTPAERIEASYRYVVRREDRHPSPFTGAPSVRMIVVPVSSFAAISFRSSRCGQQRV